MTRAVLLVRGLLGPRGSLLLLLALLLGACDKGGNLVSVEGPLDSTPPPVDSVPLVPPDTTPPPDSVPAPPDTVIPPPPPPDSGGLPPAPPPVHVGIPFGPFHLPAGLYNSYTGAYRGPVDDPLLADLETARRASSRVMLNFTGNEKWIRDENGFSMAKWKGRVDRYRGIDLSSYIADGTIIGHFLMDEPSDPSNWGGTRVTPAQVEEMAQYSKEIWPTMPTIIRAWPAYLLGYQFHYLDAAWAQYAERFGAIDAFIANNTRDAKASGLALVVGLNLLNGGTGESGIPGRRAGKWAMGAKEVRTMGGALLAEPYVCAFLPWRYDPVYFARPDIQEALADLNAEARSHPKKDCRAGGQ